MKALRLFLEPCIGFESQTVAAVFGVYGSLRHVEPETFVDLLFSWIKGSDYSACGRMLELLAKAAEDCDSMTSVEFDSNKVVLRTPTSGTEIEFRIGSTDKVHIDVDFGLQGSVDRASRMLNNIQNYEACQEGFRLIADGKKFDLYTVRIEGKGMTIHTDVNGPAIDVWSFLS